MIINQNIWQIGSGDGSRDYSQVCLDYGIAMVGPGWPGNAITSPEAYVGEADWGIKLLQVKKDDIVLLRRGQFIIKAVGIVTHEYMYSEKLNDVLGWDLNHYVEVEWYTRTDGKDIELPHAMIGYSTLSAVGKNYDEIKNIINSYSLTRKSKKASLDDLNIPDVVTNDDINMHLINHGIRIADSENISKTISRIITLAKWYNLYNFNVLEHELRTFLVVPFLLSLGWSEQKIKIEYQKIDIAIFERPFIKGDSQDPKIIIETKTFSDGLDFAKGQIESYSKGFPTCKTLVTTNGFRYNILRRNGNKLNRVSYFNLLDLRQFDYLENSIGGALDGILLLSNL